MEEALSVKGLKLITLSIGLVTLLILATLAYSGYQEATYVFQNLNQQGFSRNIAMNSTHFSISGLDLENRGIYPISLAFKASVAVDGFSIGSGSLGPLTIPPGSSRRIDLDLPIQFNQVLSNPVLAKKILFNGTLMSMRIDATGGLQPFVKGTVSGALNNTVGPALDGFRLALGVPAPHNQTHVKIPVTVGFTNRSPIPIDADLSVRIASTPRRPAEGFYGFGSTVVKASPEESYQRTVDIYVVTGAVGPGTYLADILLASQDFSYGWRVSIRG